MTASYPRLWSGEPLVLLHGGFGGAHIFGGQVPDLSARYRVFVPEQRGRMHTADLEGPITYQILAEDMIAFLDQIVGAPAHLVGVTDGGIVGLLVGRLLGLSSQIHDEESAGREPVLGLNALAWYAGGRSSSPPLARNGTAGAKTPKCSALQLEGEMGDGTE